VRQGRLGEEDLGRWRGRRVVMVVVVGGGSPLAGAGERRRRSGGHRASAVGAGWGLGLCSPVAKQGQASLAEKGPIWALSLVGRISCWSCVVPLKNAELVFAVE